MIGKEPNIKDIELELSQLVEPVSLYCDESLSPDSDPEEEEEREIYRVETECECGSVICVIIEATKAAVRTFHLLLFQELRVFCPVCAREIIRNGR